MCAERRRLQYLCLRLESQCVLVYIRKYDSISYIIFLYTYINSDLSTCVWSGFFVNAYLYIIHNFQIYMYKSYVYMCAWNTVSLAMPACALEIQRMRVCVYVYLYYTWCAYVYIHIWIHVYVCVNGVVPFAMPASAHHVFHPQIYTVYIKLRIYNHHVVTCDETNL